MNNVPITLAIQTAIGAGEVALLQGNEVLGSVIDEPNRSWSESLVPTIQRLFREAEISPRETNLIAVCRGPGSFTGIRIGIATARGFLRAIECAQCGVTSFELLAAGSNLEGNFGVGISAGRGFVFFQSFRKEKNGELCGDEPGLLSYKEFSKRLDENSDVIAMDEELEKRLAEEEIRIPDGRRFIVRENLAPVLGRIAADRFVQNKLTAIDALYLRGAVRGNVPERLNT
jgi:tRNA threonylcarbamoyl adenosine modification protein YeaZ